MSKTASVRLNAQHRVTIIDNAIGDRFDAVEKKLNENLQAIMKDVYEHIYSAKERAAIETLGIKFIRTTYYYTVQLPDGTTTSINLGDQSGGDEPVEFKNFVYTDSRGNYKMITDTTLAERVKKLLEEKETIIKERSELRHALEALVNSVSTVAGLTRIWPEGAKFYSDIEDVTKRLPAVQIQSLNKMLGLV